MWRVFLENIYIRMNRYIWESSKHTRRPCCNPQSSSAEAPHGGRERQRCSMAGWQRPLRWGPLSGFGSKTPGDSIWIVFVTSFFCLCLNHPKRWISYRLGGFFAFMTNKPYKEEKEWEGSGKEGNSCERVRSQGAHHLTDKMALSARIVLAEITTCQSHDHTCAVEFTKTGRQTARQIYIAGFALS